MADEKAAPVTESPDAEKSASGAEAAPQQQQGSASPVDLKEHAKQNRSWGINEERQRFVDDVKELGVEPVLDEMGRVNRKATLLAIAESQAKIAANGDGGKGKSKDGKEEAAEEEKPDEFSGKEKIYLAQIDAAKKAAAEAQEKAESAEKRSREVMEQSYINAAFTGLPILENAAEDVMDLFKLRRRVEMLVGGEVRVYKGKELVYVDDGANSVRPASVAEAARLFLEEHPSFMLPSARPKNLQSEAIADAHYVSSKDLAAGKVKPEDLISGKVIVRD